MSADVASFTRSQGGPARDVGGDAGTASDSEDGEAQQGGGHQGAVGLSAPPPHEGEHHVPISTPRIFCVSSHQHTTHMLNFGQTAYS